MFTTTKRYYSRTAPVFIPGNYFGNGSNGVSTTGSNFVPNASGDMVVANYTSINLINGSGFSVSAPCKGMLIYCQGDLIVSGTINMAGNSYVGTGSTDATLFRITQTGSAQSSPSIAIMGTSASVSETNQVYSWYNNGITYTIANAGGAGGARGQGPGGGAPFGENAPASTNSCGGGGGGAYYSNGGTASQTNGTSGSYSGGGVGGAGDTSVFGGGSVPGGAGGGNIILIVKGNVIISSTGIISSKGNNGVDADNISPFENAGSGGGGGGSICILYGGTYINSGSVTANGGTGGLRFDSVAQQGGNGGNGNIYIQKIRSN